MKRTPPWVFVIAVGIQLAALGLCVWAMEQGLRAEEAPPEVPPRPVPPPVPPPPEPAAAPDPIDVPAPEPVRAAPPSAPPPPPESVYAATPSQPGPGPAVIRVQRPDPRAVPIFGPPPDRPPELPADPDAIAAFITDPADATTQIVRGRAADGRFAFGFYPDGNIRFVDVDGGRYAGKAESARARMREVEGMRAFTVQIGVAADGRLQATFTGGPHGSQTIPLEPLAGWSVA